MGYCELLKKRPSGLQAGINKGLLDSGGKNKWRQEDGETQIVKNKN